MFLLTCLHLSNFCTPYSFSSFNYIKVFDSFILLCLYISCLIYLFNTYLLSTYYVAPTRGVSLVSLVVKNPSASAGDVRDSGSIPESGIPWRKAWEPTLVLPGESYGQRIPVDYTVHRVSQSRKWLKQIIQTLMGSRHWSMSWHMKKNSVFHSVLLILPTQSFLGPNTLISSVTILV